MIGAFGDAPASYLSLIPFSLLLLSFLIRACFLRMPELFELPWVILFFLEFFLFSHSFLVGVFFSFLPSPVEDFLQEAFHQL